MTANRLIRRTAALLCACLLAAGCDSPQTGPVRVIAIGPEPAIINPNRERVNAASALLLDTVAQGLVRFDAAGEIEPALAQSWIVSDDGRRYTFRLRRSQWPNGARVTAKEVVQQLRAATARNSRNPLKEVLGAVEEIEPMTEQVLEITLASPRPNFLQLLAQPEMAILKGGQGTGPYRIGDVAAGAIRLVPPPPDEDAEESELPPAILLSAEPAAAAIARFDAGLADLVTGGTIAELPLLTAAEIAGDRSVVDPARGLFGLVYASAEGPLSEPRFRHALSMAIDREALAARFNIPAFQPRLSLLPPGVEDFPEPGIPDYSTIPLDARRATAARIVAELAEGERPRIRIAMPPGPGHRIVFAHLRRDWRLIGIEAVAVEPGAPADLRLIDEVAPADLVPWYLRRFTCGQTAVCDPIADQLMDLARTTVDGTARQTLLARADRALVAAAAFIPLGQPIRWSLRSPRLNAFRPNPFARHPPTELIEQQE